MNNETSGPPEEAGEPRGQDMVAATVADILRNRQEAAVHGLTSLSEFEEDTIPGLRETAPDVLIALCETMAHDQLSGELRSTAAAYAHLPYTLDRDTGFQLWLELIRDPDSSVAQTARLTVEVAKEQGVITAEDAEGLISAHDEAWGMQLPPPDQTDTDVAASHKGLNVEEGRNRLETD